jgi:hypothetical protein
MKNLILLSVLLLLGVNLIAQSGGSVILAPGSTTPSTNLNPTMPYNYSAVVVTPSGYTANYLWQPTGHHVPTTNSASLLLPSATISWQNIPNIVLSQYSHKLKLKVTFKKTGSADTVITSNEIPITVRYLSPLTSFQVNGTGVGNNQPFNLPCGVSNVSVVTNSLTTDPSQAIVYTWTRPAGWSGPTTTSTGIATFTSNAGTGGVLSVSARRADNNFTQTWTINVTRPTAGTATISGVSPDIICVGQNKTLTATSTGASSFTWTPVGNVSIVSGQGTGTITYTASTNGSAGSFTTRGNNGCGAGPVSAARTIFRGTPTVQSATVNNGPLQVPNFVSFVGQMQLNATGTTNANWVITNGTGSLNPSGLFCQGFPNNFIRVQGTTNNTCGNGEARTFYLQLQGTSMFRIASENPTSSGIVEVEFIDPIIGEELLKEASITSENQRERVVFDIQKAKNEKHFSKSKKLSMDISKSPKGTYYLNLVIGDNKYTERIIY